MKDFFQIVISFTIRKFYTNKVKYHKVHKHDTETYRKYVLWNQLILSWKVIQEILIKNFLINYIRFCIVYNWVDFK